MALSTLVLIFFGIEILMNSFQLSMLILMVAERKNTFKGAFFNMFRIVLIADILLFITMAFAQKLALIPFITAYVKNSTFVGSITFSLVIFTTVIQFVGHAFVALNRFTLIWFPFKHEHIWRRKWYTFLIIGISFSNIFWRLHEPVLFVFLPDSIVSNVYINENIGRINNILLIVIFFATTCIAAVINFLSFLKFVIRKQNNILLNLNEKNLIFVSFVIFIAQLLRVSYNLNKLLFSSNVELSTFFNAILPILNGIFAWSGSISLMVLSSSTRRAYLKFYFCKNTFKIITTTNSPFKTMYPSSWA